MVFAAKASSGFVYYVSRTGVTGAVEDLPDELRDELRAVRKQVKLPLAVGFGVSTPQQVASLGEGYGLRGQGHEVRGSRIKTYCWMKSFGSEWNVVEGLRYEFRVCRVQGSPNRPWLACHILGIILR